MNAVKMPPPLTADSGYLEKLYCRHHEMVLRTAYRLTGSMGDAEDVLHSVFVKLMQREEEFEDDANLGPYLHRAAVNTALDILRRRRRTVPLEAVPASREAVEESQFRRVSNAELGERLRVALTTLSAHAAEVFVLRHVEGCSNQEIGRLLGISWGSVAVTLHRARRRLQHVLQTEGRVMS